MNILIEGGRLNPIERGEGTRNIALAYAKKLAKEGHNVVIFTRKKNKDKTFHSDFEIYDKIKYYRWNNLFNLVFVFKKILKKEKIDIISIFARGARPGFYIDFLKHVSKKPVVFNLLGNPFTKKYKKIQKTILAFSKADKVLVSSKTIYNNLLKRDLKNLEYFPYGIDPNKFCPSKRIPIRKRKDILCLRRPKIEMLKAIERLGKEEKILLILNNEKKTKDLDELMKEFNIDIKLIGYLKDISNLFKKVDILIDLHEEKGYLGCASPPLMILEAMACKKKVLSTKKPEIEEIIKDGKNGFLVEKNNEDLIYSKIKEALYSDKIEEQARKTIIKKYNLNKLIKEYIFKLKSLKK